MTILELREKRNKAWEAAKAFVETKRDKDGLLSAEDAATYTEMEQRVQNYSAEIARMEEMEAMEAELNRPVNTPITGKPMNGAGGQEKKIGRASNEHKEATGVKPNTLTNYSYVKNLMAKEKFGSRKISEVKTSDAKLFLIKLQQDGRGSSTIKTVRGVLRSAFQMAMDDDIIVKNPFAFQLAGVVVNAEHTREAITKEEMRKFLKFVHDDNVYCKYYEVFYILFHTGLRISEFCGLTIKDLDMKNRIINIDHQLQRLNSMEYHIESTKTNAGTRKIPMTEDVFRMFQAILEDRPTNLPEIMVNGYVGFLFRDKNGMPEVALHWEHRFKHAVNRYNSIFKVQMPKITPHICRHTYCSNQAKAGMNPKTLQYLMGHSDIGVTMNTYTHLGLDDAKNEMIRMEELEQARKEVDKTEGKKPMKQNMFKVV